MKHNTFSAFLIPFMVVGLYQIKSVAQNQRPDCGSGYTYSEKANVCVANEIARMVQKSGTYVYGTADGRGYPHGYFMYGTVTLISGGHVLVSHEGDAPLAEQLKVISHYNQIQIWNLGQQQNRLAQWSSSEHLLTDIGQSIDNFNRENSEALQAGDKQRLESLSAEIINSLRAATKRIDGFEVHPPVDDESSTAY